MAITSAVIGNILLVEEDANSGMLMAYRQDGEIDADFMASFPNTERGIVIASLFAGYMATMFHEGPITQEVIDKLMGVERTVEDNDSAALAEINRLKLFGTNVELQP